MTAAERPVTPVEAPMSRGKEPTCTYTVERGWCTPEHERDCRAVDCRGCRPCGKTHCGLRGCPHHVDTAAGIFTCPSCIGKARRDVRKIVERYAELPNEYEYAGVDSEVLNLHGPAADPGQWAERRKRLVQAYEARGWCDYPQHGALAPDDPHHPYAVLGKWDIALRESYGPQTDLLVTVSRAADYLSGEVLDRFAHTREFEEFANEVRTCLSHLEDVLALSRRPERGAPCPTCRLELEALPLHKDDCEDDTCKGCREKAPRLEKRLAEHHPRIENRAMCTKPGCRVCAGDLDTWHCPRNPDHWWSAADYRSKVDAEYVEHATELPARELAERLGVPPSTVRSWIAPTRHVKNGAVTYSDPKLKSSGSIKGRRAYSVKAAMALLERREGRDTA